MFEVNIRFIGGLLAAYYLSGQEVSALKGAFPNPGDHFWGFHPVSGVAAIAPPYENILF